MSLNALLTSFCAPTLHLAAWYDMLDDPQYAWNLITFDQPPSEISPPADEIRELNRTLEQGLYVQCHRLGGADLFWWARLVSALRERAGLADDGVFPGNRLKGVELLLHLILDIRPPQALFRSILDGATQKNLEESVALATQAFSEAALGDHRAPLNSYLTTLARRIGDCPWEIQPEAADPFPVELPGKRLTRLGLVVAPLLEEAIDLSGELARQLLSEFNRLLPLVEATLKSENLDLLVGCASVLLRIGDSDKAVKLLGRELVKDGELMLALVGYAKLGAERALTSGDSQRAETLYSLAKNGMARFNSPEAQAATRYFELQLKKLQKTRG